MILLEQSIVLTFASPTSLKKKFPIPFVITQIYRNFAAWWSAARRASNPYANYPAMTTFPVASPLPTNKTKQKLQNAPAHR